MNDDRSDWHIVQPQGLAMVLLSVTVVFSALCTTIVCLRMWIRSTLKMLGSEDWLMCIGLVLNLVHNGIVVYGALTGLGTPDSRLNTAQLVQGGMAVVLWQLFYVSSSAFIKSSICTTLLRIAGVRREAVYVLRGLIAITVFSTLVAMIGVFVRCKPMQASWNPSLGTCIDQTIIIILTYVISGVNIFTDLTVAILPVIILWNMRMSRRLKVVAGVVLGVGLLASVATIIRMPYSSAYSDPHDQLYNLGNIILWTVVECSLGIIAGSLPMIRQIFGVLTRDGSSAATPKVSHPDDLELVTIGRVRGRHNPMYDTDHIVTIVRGDVPRNDCDGESTKRMIKVQTSFEQTSSGGDSVGATASSRNQ